MRRRRWTIFVVAGAAVIAAAVIFILAKSWPDPVDPTTVADVTVLPRGLNWTLIVRPDGSAALQAGSGILDWARVPPGTVDFAAVVSAAVRQRADYSTPDQTRVSLRRRGENSTLAFSLIDDGFVDDLLSSLEDKWRQDVDPVDAEDAR